MAKASEHSSATVDSALFRDEALMRLRSSVWQAQLADKVAPLLPEDMPVWLRADNACYRGGPGPGLFCQGLGLLDQRDQKPATDASAGAWCPASTPRSNQNHVKRQPSCY